MHRFKLGRNGMTHYCVCCGNPLRSTPNIRKEEETIRYGDNKKGEGNRFAFPGANSSIIRNLTRMTL